MRISAIAAIGGNRELGKRGDLLWKIPEDMEHFRTITRGHTVIMGRKTWESLPPRARPLPGRMNIVITKDENFFAEGASVVHSIEEAIKIAESSAAPRNDEEDEVFIIGGGQIYKEALLYTDRLYLTVIDASDKEADAFFPDYSEFRKVIGREEHESGGYTYTFLTLEK